MTLTATTSKVAYAGNGSTTSFAVTFIYWDDTDVRVILSTDSTGAETVWTDGTQYTLTGGSGATGTLTIDTSPTDYTPASGETLTIKSNLPDTQSTSLPLGGSLPSTSIEERLDKSVRLIQQVAEEMTRAIQFPESSTATSVTIPSPSALEMIRWNSGETDLENITLSDLSLGLGTATKWAFDTSTSMADPGTGDVRFNNATLASVTQISVSYKSSQSGNPDISDWVAAWDDSTNDAIRGHIMIHEDGTPSNFWTGYINGAITDNSTWLQIPVTHIDSGGSFAASDNMVVGFSRAGDAGAGGFDMLWDADTSDSDSGAGKVWFNNGTLASVSIVYIDDLDNNGVSINALVDTFDDSTTTALRGTLKITKKGTPATYAVYNVNGAVTSASTYSKVAVAHVISNGTFTDGDPAYMEFFRTGNIGIGGISMAWETTTTDTDQGAGKCWTNNGTLSSATVFYMDDVDSNSADVNTYVDLWDDSTNRPIRGTIIVRELASPANFVVFSVTGAVTSASTYSKIAVTHVATGGSMTDGNAMSVEFYRAGDTPPIIGLDMLWDSDTSDADSGAGKIYFNNGTLSSVTVVYVDDVDVNSTSINSYVDSWDDSTNLDLRGTITVKKKADNAVFAKYNVTGVVTSASTYSKVAVTHVVSAGSFTDADPVAVDFVRSGDRGPNAGLDMTFETTTTDTDQGVGKLWLNNGTVSSATVVYLDDVDDNSVSINSFVDSFDDSSSSVKGHIQFEKQFDPTVFALFNVTGSVTSASTYSKVACTYVTGAGSFSDGDKISTTFIRGGDKGTTGSTGTASSGFHYQFETSTSDSDQGAGKVWLNNGTVGSATVFYIDDDDNDGTDISAFVATWDDSSATSDKGFIKIQSRATPTDYAVFKISSSGTDNTAYWEFPVTHLVSAGTLSDTEVVDVFFTRSGDSGGVANRTVDTMTGDASDTTLSLSQSPGSTNNCTCFIDGVGQHPGTDFNISGSTLTFTTAPPTGAVVVAICGGNESIGTPSDGTVTLAKMAVNSIDSDQYVDGSIDNAHLAANSVDSANYVDGSIDGEHLSATMNPSLTSTGKALVLGF
jgi:hypothetical protein